VLGLVDCLEGGLRVPAQVSDATREFREESDPVGTFLDQCCVITGEHVDSISARELADAVNYWLSEAGMGEWKPKTIGMKLTEKAGRWKSRTTGKAFVKRKSSTISYDGIRFTDTFGHVFRGLPRDQQGRILRGRSVSGDGDD
jgi:putative DNA primase/helicase